MKSYNEMTSKQLDQWFYKNYHWLQDWLKEVERIPPSTEQPFQIFRTLLYRDEVYFWNTGKYIDHLRNILLALVFGLTADLQTETEDGILKEHRISGFCEKYGRLPKPTDIVSVKIIELCKVRNCSPFDKHLCSEISSIELLKKG